MCHWSSYGYDERSGARPTRSFFEALRDLFRRPPRPEPEREAGAEIIPLPVRGAARQAPPPSKPDRPHAA